MEEHIVELKAITEDNFIDAFNLKVINSNLPRVETGAWLKGYSYE